jgi:hypothetical protein
MTPSLPAPPTPPGAAARRRPTGLRTALGLVAAGAAAPVAVLLVLLLTVTIGGLMEGKLPRADFEAFNAFVFFALIALYFGAPVSIAVTVLVGAPGVWLARRLDATSATAFALGGAGAGIAALVGFGILTSAGLDGDWFSWGPIFLVAGTASALVYWAIAERPFRP